MSTGPSKETLDLALRQRIAHHLKVCHGYVTLDEIHPVSDKALAMIQQRCGCSVACVMRPRDRYGLRPEAPLSTGPVDMDVYAFCLSHRRQVRWLQAPMWWHHTDDLSTCSRMLADRAPRRYADQ
jgi:hypothetical protein